MPLIEGLGEKAQKELCAKCDAALRELARIEPILVACEKVGLPLGEAREDFDFIRERLGAIRKEFGLEPAVRGR